MPKVSASTSSPASPEQVWQLAVDLPRYAEWLTMHDAFSGDVPGTLEEGAAYKQRVKMMGMPADIAWKVATANSPGHLEITGDGPMGIKAINRFLIEPGEGGSNITFEMEFNGPALNGPMAKMAEKNAGAAAEASLEKFKNLLG
ncbi:type II toxin-antitoxin system Rv0910 family toxin [Catelliglobosispora koreensis]|uniref:type II toxin-antitoxin system Rv0910 family toxin n=1 Tax=Catelliglobosispora koreensis TaxID=129052 RepID=UPI000371068E|nr:SRPBCC family protein [Catelliglobosispora koreensis]